jgi:cytochrome c-type biogenesis protein CcmH
MRRAFAAFALALFSACAFGQSTEVAHPDPGVEKRLKALAEELRCLVCQNQTIADSHAPLAVDLRSQIRTQIAQGKSDGDIRDYMVARYGDFVLYRPPFRATTAVLWLGPLLLVLGGVIALVIAIRRRGAARSVEAPPPKRRKELERLLSDGKD